jgi:two-component system, sensor histidine kinase LadS
MLRNQAIVERFLQAVRASCFALCALLCHAGASALDVRQAEQGLGVEPALLWWLDTSGQIEITDIASGKSGASFAPRAATGMQTLARGQKLWARLDLYRAAGSPQEWALSLPITLVDKLTLYQPRVAGQPPPAGVSSWPAAQSPDPRWHLQTAGDRVAVDRWPVPGRYPVFHLSLGLGTTTVYLAVENETPLPVPFALAPLAQMVVEQQVGALGVGLVVGVMAFLALVCAVTGYIYRDFTYVLYAGFVVLMSLAVAALTGIAAQLLWPSAPAWADLAVGVLTLLAAGIALLFLNTNMGVYVYAPRSASALQLLGYLAPVLAAIFTQVARPVGVVIVGAYILVAALGGLGTAVWRLREGDAVARWILWAYVPLVAAILLLLLRIAGILPAWWVVQNGVTLALLVQVPCMLVALNIRSRERHAAQTRELALNREDALTGLLTMHVFQDRLEHALRRTKGVREPCALLMARLINHEQIVGAYGEVIGQQAYTRSGLKLRRILRDVDSAARVDGAYFAVLLPGHHKRDDLQALCARLIAVGLMPIVGAQPPFPLQFHVCVTMLHNKYDTVGNLLDAMRATLAGMNLRTRRVIRWLDESAQGEQGEQDNSESAPRSQPEAAASPLPLTQTESSRPLFAPREG